MNESIPYTFWGHFKPTTSKIGTKGQLGQFMRHNIGGSTDMSDSRGSKVPEPGLDVLN